MHPDVFSDNDTFHIPVHLHYNTICTWGRENPHAIAEKKCDSPKAECSVLRLCYWPTYNTITDSSTSTCWNSMRLCPSTNWKQKIDPSTSYTPLHYANVVC